MGNQDGKSVPDAAAPAGFSGIIGVSRRDITPPPGINARNWGAAALDIAQGVHRPLLATALTLQAADRPPLVLVALDLGWWRDRDDEAIVRRGILHALGLPEERLIMALSHTHAGPCTSLLNAEQPGGQLIRAYLETLRDACVQAITAALAGATQAQLSWGLGRCALASNRDLRDMAGSRFLTGYNPDAAADDTLLVGRITTDAGRPLATLVNYACHPTTLAWENTLISPDYVGAMREVIEAHTDGAPCLFLQGASGELAPREQYTADVAVADRHGRALGWACLSTLEAMPAPGMRLGFDSVVESGAPLAVWREVPWRAPDDLDAVQSAVALPLKPDLQSLAEIEAQLARTNDAVTLERLRRRWGVRRIVGDGDAWAMPIYAWRIGDALLVAQPNEAYSWLQQELRRRFAPRVLAVLNLSNGSCGYLAPAALYAEDIYAVWQSPFAAGGLEALVERATAVLATLLNDKQTS
jgi:hypothetical protein